MKASEWFAPESFADNARVDLICLPFAGGWSSTYYPWRALLKDRLVNPVPILLPGRERRLHVPPYESITRLVEELADVLASKLVRPFALFGHSMGGLIAFETARRLQSEFALKPALLVVSGHREPMSPDLMPPLHREPLERLIAHVRELGGMRQEILENRELLELLLPTLRADIAICATYRYCPEPMLDCPVIWIAGEQDERSPAHDMKGWADITTGPCSGYTLPGGHFFIDSARDKVVEHVLAALSALELA